jgi:hypothetical protein
MKDSSWLHQIRINSCVCLSDSLLSASSCGIRVRYLHIENGQNYCWCSITSTLRGTVSWFLYAHRSQKLGPHEYIRVLSSPVEHYTHSTCFYHTLTIAPGTLHGPGDDPGKVRHRSSMVLDMFVETRRTPTPRMPTLRILRKLSTSDQRTRTSLKESWKLVRKMAWFELLLAVCGTYNERQ